MIRRNRWIRLLLYALAVLAGLLLLAMLALHHALESEGEPRGHRTVWLDGPGEARIRGVSWEQGGSWVDNPYAVHEYTLVTSAGEETPIGRGPEALDAEGVRLVEHGDQAELIVGDTVFRRPASGRWVRFRATDADFVYRHYTPLTDDSIHRTPHSWRSRFTGIRCSIEALDPVAHTMVSHCGSGPGQVSLAFRRDSYEDLWSLDVEATRAGTPPRPRAPFPEGVRGTLTVLRAFPARELRALPVDEHRLEVAARKPGVEEVAQVSFELPPGALVHVPIGASGPVEGWPIGAGWVTPEGWPVVFWQDRSVRAAPWGEAALAAHYIVTREEASYLLYLELSQPEQGGRER